MLHDHIRVSEQDKRRADVSAAMKVMDSIVASASRLMSKTPICSPTRFVAMSTALTQERSSVYTRVASGT